MNDDDLTLTPPRTAFGTKRRYVTREPVLRQRMKFEHSLGQFSTDGDKLYEFFEIVSTMTGEWTCDYEWRECLT